MADSKLLTEISAQLASGISEEQIRATQLTKGWSLEDINGALAISKIQHAPMMSGHIKETAPIVAPTSHVVSRIALMVILFSVSATAYGYFVNTGIPILSGYTAAIESIKSFSPAGVISPKPTDSVGVSTQTIATSAPIKVYHNSGYTYAPSPTATAATIPGSVEAISLTTEPPTLTITAQYASITRGMKLTLRWSSTNATTCTSKDISVGYRTKGSITIAPNVTSTYTITCTGPAGELSKTITVGVGALIAASDPAPVTPSTPPIDPGAIDPGPVAVIPPPDTLPPPVVPPPTPIPPPDPVKEPPPPPAPGATVNNPAELAAVLKTVTGGETIKLAGGTYGDYQIKDLNPASTVTIAAADTGNPPVFHTLTVLTSSNLAFNHINATMTGTATSYAWQAAVQFTKCTNISFLNGKVMAGPSINGVAEDATARDKTDNIIGRPYGYGIAVGGSSNILIQGNEVTQVDRGITMGLKSSDITVRNNEVHDIRRTAIVGSSLNNVTVDGNYLHSSHPWKWGQTPLGDHADFLAFWTDTSNQTTSSSNIKITNNRMVQGSGTAILGMWFQGTNASLGFRDSIIRNNVFIDNNFQAVSLRYTSDTVVDHNVMLRTEGDYKQAPAILFTTGSTRNRATNNLTRSVNDLSGSTGVDANTHSGNLLIQRDDATKTGYYNPSLVAQAAGMSDATAIYNLVQSSVTPGPLVSKPSAYSYLLASVFSSFLGTENMVLTLTRVLPSWLRF